MTDSHRENIFEYRNWLEEEIAKFLTAKEGYSFDDMFLEITVWVQEEAGLLDYDRYKIELLITCGGPTVVLEYDSRWNLGILRHSWGMDNDGSPLERIEYDGDQLREIADMVVR